MKTSANITGVFDLDTGRLIGLAPKGTSDVTYVAGQDSATPAGALPVTATTDPVTGGIDIWASGKRVSFNRLSRKSRTFFNSAKLADFTASALGGTITEAADTADGYYAGGNIITMAQTTTAGPKNILTTKDPFYVPALGNQSAWFATAEFQVPSGSFITFNGTDASVTSLFSFQVGAPNNRVTCKLQDGTSITLDPANFSQADWFRLLAVVTPDGSTTGTIHYFIYWTDTVSGTEKHAKIGTQSYSSNALVAKLVVTQSWVALGNVSVGRMVAGEVMGVTNGCSLDAGYVGFCMAPKNARTFAAGSYNIKRNPATLLSSRINGNDDWYINQARGGHTVSDMVAEFAPFVTALRPKIISIGSATNSLNNALDLSSGPVRDSFIATEKASYLSMCVDGLASGAMVIATGIAPRHDAHALAQLSTFAALAADWNSWMDATIKPLGVGVVQVWNDLVDPVTANQLVSWADAGDHVHLSWRGQELIADRQFQQAVG